jgi:hypothetical protein
MGLPVVALLHEAAGKTLLGKKVTGCEESSVERSQEIEIHPMTIIISSEDCTQMDASLPILSLGGVI